MTRSTESTSETEGSRSKASCFRRSSSSVVAEDSALDPLEQAGQARVAREALHELLVVEDLVADLPQLLGREVEELAALEALGVDAVGDPLELDGPCCSSSVSRAA